MNGKTSRMLNKLALVMGQPPKKVKKVWNNLPKPERSKNRDQIWRLLSKMDDRVKQKQSDQVVQREKNRKLFLKHMQPYRQMEEKARQKRMKRKNKAQREAVGYGFFGGLLGWFGGKFNGSK